MRLGLLCGVLLHCLSCSFTQRVAPGVPPQNYQQHGQHVPHHVQHQQVPVQPQYQPPPPQHQYAPQHQQPQQQQQQHSQQQQQQHHQQQQQQQHHQQQGAPQGHQPHAAHQSGHHNPQLLSPGNIAHEKQHIQDHMEVPIDTSKMSEQELQFHYFKMHDADNNNKLDGCELIKSLIHWHGDEKERNVISDESLAATVDEILQMADVNNDGYLDYAEFKRVQAIQEEEESQKHR